MDNTKPTCEVRFSQLMFGNECFKPVFYRQFHCRVIIDSRLGAHIDECLPERSRFSDKETLITVSGKATETKAGGVAIGATTTGFNIGASGTYTRAVEEGTSSATKHSIEKITTQAKAGIACWGYHVHDPNLQQGGTVLEETERPTVTFTFQKGANKIAPIPKEIDVEVASFWSIIPGQTAGRLSKIISNGSSVTQFSHLCQMTLLNIPTDLKEDFTYSANLIVDTTGAGLQVATEIVHPCESVKIKSEMTRKTDETPFDYGKLLPFRTYQMAWEFFF